MKHLIIPFCLLSAAVAFGQDEKWGTPEPSKPLPPAPKQEEKIALQVDEPARFPGDSLALQVYIRKNLAYPPAALEKGNAGTCKLRIIVDAGGNVRFDRWLEDITQCPDCNKEALRIVKSMPKWIPARLEGKPVASFCDLSIPFTPTEAAGISQPIATEEKTEAFQYVDEPAEFPGGMSAMRTYIAEHLRYPEKAKEKGIQGKCFVQFTVEETGKIANVKVARGVPDCPECDQEAIRMVSSMPNWKPGKSGGKIVASVFNLPVKFALPQQ